MTDQLKIGDFARLTGVPQKTLRYYDEIGLFQPAAIDPDNGYRTYTRDQLALLNQILWYRSLGFPLAHIKRLVHDGDPPELVRGMLRARRQASEAQLAQAQQQLDALDAGLAEADAQLAVPARVAGYMVELKAIPAVRVAARRGTAPSLMQCGAVLNELAERVIGHVLRHGATLAGPGIALYHAFSETAVELEFAQPVAGELPAGEGVAVYELPGVAQAATVIHAGPVGSVEPAHEALMQWAAAEGYEIGLPVRDVYLHFDPAGDPADHLVEIQYPVLGATA